MLEYAMYVLAALCFVVLPFPVEIYARRREPRYLWLFSLGWTLLGLSPLLYLASERIGSLWGAFFEATMLAGVLLLVSGALSYFAPLSVARVTSAILGGCTLLLVLFIAVPSTKPLGMIGQMLALLGPASYGILHRREFSRIGGRSYFWLVGVLGTAGLSVTVWIQSTFAPQGLSPVWPWIVTTAMVMLAAIFLVVLELSTTQVVLEDKQRELEAYQNNLERLVTERTAELEDANKAKSEFLALMSHELRTPLNSIIGFSEIMLSGMAGEINEEQERQLGMVHASGERLLALVNDILDLSKIEAGAVTVELRETNVNRICSEAVEQMRPQAEDKGVELRFTPCTKECSNCGKVMMDQAKLMQIVLNLLSNSVKFTKAGSVECRIECDGEKTIFIRVTDTGVGIGIDALERIFDVFEQVPIEDEAKTQGTGLGLSISRKLANLLGGDLTVKSTLSSGSEFTLELPLQLADDPEE